MGNSGTPHIIKLIWELMNPKLGETACGIQANPGEQSGLAGYPYSTTSRSLSVFTRTFSQSSNCLISELRGRRLKWA